MNQNEESSESAQKIAADEPVQSIEGGDDAKPVEEKSANANPAEESGVKPTEDGENTKDETKEDGKDESQEKDESQDSQITEEQWRAMMDLVLAIYEYREEEYVSPELRWSRGLTQSSGHDPSKLFQRSVNKRNVPDYYEVIKEPMALSILKQKINKREYKHFSEFVRDCALVGISDRVQDEQN